MLYAHPQEPSRGGIERRFPELARVHLAEPLVARHFDPLAPHLEDRVQELSRRQDGEFLILAHELAPLDVDRLQAPGALVEPAGLGAAQQRPVDGIGLGDTAQGA